VAAELDAWDPTQFESYTDDELEQKIEELSALYRQSKDVVIGVMLTDGMKLLKRRWGIEDEEDEVPEEAQGEEEGGEMEDEEAEGVPREAEFDSGDEMVDEGIEVDVEQLDEAEFEGALFSPSFLSSFRLTFSFI
jgi:hypothetical protein